MFLDLGKNLGTSGAPHGAPMEPPWSPRPPIQGATFENPFRRPCLLIATDFKTIPRGASDIFDCGKNLGTHGAPQAQCFQMVVKVAVQSKWQLKI